MNAPETTFEQASQYLTKYYPFSGWLDERLIEGVRTFFTNHDHRNTMQGKYARIVYDSEFDEMAKSRDDITARIGEVLVASKEK
jgi:hypothetical protein